MISDQARHVIDRIFGDAVRANLPMSADDRVELSPATEAEERDAPPPEVMVITSSSFLFRLLTVFDVDNDARTAEYFARGHAGVPLAESFAEVANLCCGAINRELNRYFPHLGMSTPYVLSGRCLDFIGDLNPQHVARYQVAINDSVRVGATLCLCGAESLDFTAAAPLPGAASAADAEIGELELF